MKAVLIDDEIDSVRLLARQLHKHCPQVAILAVCTTPEEGLAAIQTERPDLVFLDIEMPRMNGSACWSNWTSCPSIWFSPPLTTATL